MKTTKEMLDYLTSNNYVINKADSGYYYLTQNNEDGTNSLIICDSACEDYYDYDSAIYMFYSNITGYAE